MSGDPEQEYFSDGITEDIITALSRLRWFFVIARNSTFIYKGRAVDVKTVGRELGVRYFPEGSVRKSSKHLRSACQLIDARTSAHIWAQNFDRELTDIFELKDETTRNVTSAIEPKLVAAEASRAHGRSPEDLDAWDLVMRALSHYWRMTSSESEAAIAMLRTAVKRFPGYGPAHSILAFALLVSGHVGWIVESEDLSEAESLAQKAAEIDDEDPWAHLALGYVAFAARRTEEAVYQCQRAIDLNPNFSTAYGYMGWALAFDGQSEAAREHFQRALTMSPNDPLQAFYCSGTGVSHYYEHNYDEAVAWSRKAIGVRPGFIAAHRILCASPGMAGRSDEAASVLAKLRALHPRDVNSLD